MNIQESLSGAPQYIANKLAAVGRAVEPAARGLGHASLLATATASDICGTAILALGFPAVGVLAYDSFCWHNWVETLKDAELPVWSHLYGQNPAPVILVNPYYQNPGHLEEVIEKAISVQILGTMTLAVVVPLASYACSKISTCVKQIDRDLFQRA